MFYYFFSCDKRFSKKVRETKKNIFFPQILKVSGVTSRVRSVGDNDMWGRMDQARILHPAP